MLSTYLELYRNESIGNVMDVSTYTAVMTASGVCGLLLSLAGMLVNIINIKTFLAIGISDGVAALFTSLAISEFAESLATFILSLYIVYHALEIPGIIMFTHDPLMIATFSLDLSNVVHLVSVLTTTALAVHRCLCVAQPIYFKTLCTRRRSIFLSVSIYVVTMVGHIPLFINQGSKKEYVESQNKSRYSLWFTNNRCQIKDATFFIAQTVIPVAVEVVLIVCVVVMSKMLRKSRLFRQSATHTEHRPLGTPSHVTQSESRRLNQGYSIDELFIQDIDIERRSYREQHQTFRLFREKFNSFSMREGIKKIAIYFIDEEMFPSTALICPSPSCSDVGRGDRCLTGEGSGHRNTWNRSSNCEQVNTRERQLVRQVRGSQSTV